MTQSSGVGIARSEWAPPGIDTTVPHSARMYDWWIGGKDNFAADRAMGAAFAEIIPDVREMARANRDFMCRAVRFLARAGIDQFLDIGTGIPTRPNVHELAQQINPRTRVVYLDNDPIVLAHARALLVSGDRGTVTYIDADLRDPDRILAHPTLTCTLDLDRPVGLLLIAVLMLVADRDDPWGKVATLLDALPSGSHVAICQPGYDFDPDTVGAVAATAAAGGMTMVPRSRVDVTRFFGDWELIEPGVVPVLAWRPDGEPPVDPDAAYYWAGIARKP